MGWSRVQANQGLGSSVSVLSVAFTSAVASGDMLVAFEGATASAGLTSMGDTAGNTYNLNSGPIRNTCEGRGWSVDSCASYGANNNGATVNLGKSVTALHLHIAEYNGQLATPLDVTGSGTGASTTPDTNTFTTTGANDLLSGFVFGSSGSASFTPGTGLSTVNNQNNGAVSTSAVQEQLNVAAAGYHTAATFGKSETWVNLAMSFKGTAVAGGTTVPTPMRTLLGAGI